MYSHTFIKKIHMECPLCERTHEVEERTRNTTTIIKNEEVLYVEKYYYCSNSDEDENEFETGAMTNENLLAARNAYRVKHNLLTSNEIIEIREGYGLSQVDLAKLLGWGEATISRYESKAIQDEPYDEMLRLIKDNPLKALELLKKNSEKFPRSKFVDIRNKIIEKIDSYGKEYLSRQTFEGEYANYNEPSDSNGNTLLDIDKIEAIISYFAGKVDNLFKVKLMKMLWFSDALSYKLNDRAITGLVYRHNSMGALPVGHYSLMNLQNLNIVEEESENYDLMLHVYENKNTDYSIITEDELTILNTVISKFKNWKAAQIVNYMHDEEAYKKTNSGEIIPFYLAKELRSF